MCTRCLRRYLTFKKENFERKISESSIWFAEFVFLEEEEEQMSNFLSGSLHPNVDKMLEKFIRGKEYQSAKYEEARGVLELRFGIVNRFVWFCSL